MKIFIVFAAMNHQIQSKMETMQLNVRGRYHTLLSTSCCIDKQLSGFIAIDIEGAPVVEIGAIAFTKGEIVGAFHLFPKQSSSDLSIDWYARMYIHGVPEDLNIVSIPWLAAFKRWREKFSSFILIANAPVQEEKFFGEAVMDVRLKNWVDRAAEISHLISRFFKSRELNICGVCCCLLNHGLYKGHKVKHNKPSEADLVKIAHGHHCALYDAFEVCLRVMCEQYQVINLQDCFIEVFENLLSDGTIEKYFDIIFQK